MHYNPVHNIKMNTFHVGDTIVVTSKIKEKDKDRLTKFKGIVIAKRGAGISKTFIVRKIGKGNIGVERIYPLHSPNITNIEVVRQGRVRRAKLYYLRERTGKAATYVKPAHPRQS
ncbi:50S ribosomal protein L19 [Patescibacteria group bacterium]|nr:50S ribosomal protein L19 [Patescibacteria group bacterium]